MLPHRATPAGTTAYAGRFPQLPKHFRPLLGLAASSIGIGTYLGEPDEATDAAYGEALASAIRGGINLIDTAVNYRFQRSERVIGRVIADLVASGAIRREELIIATKGGYITFDGAVPPDPRAWFEEHYIRPGIVDPHDLVDGSHCMTPRWLDAMIERSRANLGLATIDIYYLHNPEAQLGAVSREEFRRRVHAAFELLERKVTDGAIAAYGLATWNGFRAAANDRAHLELKEMVALAHEVAGAGNHFHVIQLPYNLAMPEAFITPNQELPDGARGTMLAAADATGLAVCASAALMQGRLTRGMPPILAEACPGLESDAQRALQFVRSTPGVNVALTGMSSTAHVEHNLATARHPPAEFSALMKLFQPADR